MQVAPGIQATEFVERRSQLISNVLKRAQEIDNCPSNHVIVIPGATRSYMSEKIPYVFRQNSDFYYLTGCLEQESLLVLVASRESYRAIMFMRPKDSHSELWDGPRTGRNQTKARTKIKVTISIQVVGDVERVY